MTYTELENNVFNVLNGISTAHFIPLNDNSPRPDLPYITVQLNNFIELGSPDYTLSDSSGNITQKTTENFTLSLIGYGVGANDILKEVKDNIKRQTVQRILYINCLTFVDVLLFTPIPLLIDSTIEKRYSLDLSMRYTDSLEDNTGFINAVDITNNIGV